MPLTLANATPAAINPACAGHCHRGHDRCPTRLSCRLAAQAAAGRATARNPWPFGELSQDQRLAKARFEARMRAGTLRGLPSVFGELA